jgi:RsiW-degrading membrane proteinase PrsW (M82 family)
MMSILLFSLGFTPGVFWLWFFYKQDKWDPEPKKLVAKTFLLGMLATVVAYVAEWPFINTGMVLTIIAAPFIEELLKFGVVRGTVYSQPDFNEPMDGFTYAAAASLGFASLENAKYILEAYYHASNANQAWNVVWSTTLVRTFLSVPGHVLFSGMWGYALGQAKFRKKENMGYSIPLGLLLAIGSHGLFNALTNLHAAGMIALSRLLWSVYLKNSEEALSESPFSPVPIQEPQSELEENKNAEETMVYECGACHKPVHLGDSICSNCHEPLEW